MSITIKKFKKLSCLCFSQLNFGQTRKFIQYSSRMTGTYPHLTNLSLVKNLIMKNIFFTITLLGNFAFADGFPRGCEVTGFGYNGTNLVFNTNGEQAFYLIQNRGDRGIELQRVETRNAFMSPSLTARLQPGNWAAFASDIENLHFQCFYVENATNEKVDCRDVLDVCQYPRAKFALSNMGNYWVSVNKDQRHIINDSTAKGIYLHW